MNTEKKLSLPDIVVEWLHFPLLIFRHPG